VPPGAAEQVTHRRRRGQIAGQDRVHLVLDSSALAHQMRAAHHLPAQAAGPLIRQPHRGQEVRRQQLRQDPRIDLVFSELKDDLELRSSKKITDHDRAVAPRRPRFRTVAPYAPTQDAGPEQHASLRVISNRYQRHRVAQREVPAGDPKPWALPERAGRADSRSHGNTLYLTAEERRPNRANPTGQINGWKSILNTPAMTYGDRLGTN